MSELDDIRAELAQLRAENAVFRERLEKTEQQVSALRTLAKNLLAIAMAEAGKNRRRKSQKRPLPMSDFPRALQNLLTDEAQVLLQITLQTQTAGIAPALPAGPKVLEHKEEASNPDDPQESTESSAAEIPPKDPTKTKRHRGAGSGRRARDGSLERRTKQVPVPGDALLPCECCGGVIRVFDTDTNEILRMDFAKLYNECIVRPKYSCRRCRNKVIQEPLSLPLEGVQVGADVLAQLAVDKFVDGLPLYRMEKRYAMWGAKIPRSSMSRWLDALGGMCSLLVQETFVPQLFKAPVVHTDATGTPIQAKGQTKLGHMFVYYAVGEQGVADTSKAAGMDDHGRAVVLFQFAKSHNSEAVKKIVSGCKKIVCDGATIYDSLMDAGEGTPERCGCWSHVRAKFVEARWMDSILCDEVLRLIGLLFDADRDTCTLAADERTTERARRSAEPLRELKAYLEKQTTVPGGHNPLHVAIRYALRQWSRLIKFLLDSRIPLTNNVAERALRVIAIGRKNWLFVGSEAHGSSAAGLLSVAATCLVNGISPLAYFQWLFERIARWDRTKLGQLTPWYYKQLQQNQRDLGS